MPSLRARSLMELITVTRATTASYCGSDGLLALAAAGVPRIDFDPVTRVSRGLLVEEARTNLLLRSEEFDNAAWTKAGATVTANGRLAPDGLITMDKIEEDSSTGAHYVHQPYTKTSSTEVQPYALSCWAVAAERSEFRLRAQGLSGTTHSATCTFNLISGLAGTPVISGNYDSAMAWVEDWGGGLFRCCLTFRINNDGQVSTHPVLMIADGGESHVGTTGFGFYLWGAQLEKGPFPTSYMPTVAATVTRNADEIRMASLSPWLEEEAAGTIIAEFSVPRTFSTLDTISRRVIEISADVNNRHLVYTGSGKMASQTMAAAVVAAGGVSAIDQPARNGVGRIGWTWQQDNFARAINGSIDLLDTLGPVPATLAFANLGASGSAANLCGHLRRFRFYPRRVSNTELQQLTKAA